MIDKTIIEKWNAQLKDASPVEVIAFFLNEFKEKIALSTSLGMEDQILTEMVSSVSKTARVFTLDTGRLFPEAYDLISTTSNKYKKLRKWSLRRESICFIIA